MHGAPSVNFPVGRSSFGRLAALACWLTALAAWAGWCLASPAPARQGLVAAVLAGCGLWAWRALRREQGGALSWDGSAWHWQEAAAGAVPGASAVGSIEVVPEVCADLQRLLLVRLAPVAAAGPARWLWLVPSAAPALWGDVRRALYSRHTSEAQPQRLVANP
jgi:hypothetical protein